MKFRDHKKLTKGLESINLLPLIDVIFQLLIFFMLTSSFSFPSGINVKLPKTVTSEKVQHKALVVSITSENVIYYDDKVSTIKEISRQLSEAKDTTRSVLIKADQRSSVGRIIEVWDLCRELGIETINIATNQNR